MSQRGSRHVHMYMYLVMWMWCKKLCMYVCTYSTFTRRPHESSSTVVGNTGPCLAGHYKKQRSVIQQDSN